MFWCVALATLALDQLTKALVRAAIPLGELRTLLPGLVDLTHVRNMGAAFGLFPGRQPIFVATSLVVLLVIGAYWRRDRPVAWPVVIGIALVAGGAFGNLIDRIVLTRVTDFLAFTFIDFPVFNVADMGILAGTGTLIIWLLFGPEPDRAPAPPGDDHPFSTPTDESRPTGDAE